MVRVRTTSRLSPDERRAVLDFLHAAHALDSARLNDHLQLDLAQGPRDGFLAALAEDHAGRLVGYGQASAGNDGHVIDAIVRSSLEGDSDAATSSLLSALVAALPADGCITWWAHSDDASREAAARLGMQPDRTLLVMERTLPAPFTERTDTRPFRPGHDEAAWLEVNNAAFATHGEQGGWDLATLRQREAEEWFDPSGFLLHERDGRLAAFCWVKLHRHSEPPSGHIPSHTVGEIYVIAAHPDFHGLGLGRRLTVAGLQYMHQVGATSAMLYVDAGNLPAVRLYESLGFTVAHTNQSYLRPARSNR